MLHPFTTTSTEPVPTTHELLTDANLQIVGNSYEASIAVQDQAEAEYAALCCDEAERERDARILNDTAMLEFDRQSRDEATAEQELLNVIERYGILAANDLIQRVADVVVARHFNVARPKRITTPVRKVNWSAFGVSDPDGPAAA